MWRHESASRDLKSDYEIGNQDKLVPQFQAHFLKSVLFSSGAHFFHRVKTKSCDIRATCSVVQILACLLGLL